MTMAPSSASRRREAIVTQATTVGLASVEQLSKQFGVTASTIRRDLTALQSRGRLARTFGGAIAVTLHPEASLRQRLGENFDQKRAIGRWAAAQVAAGHSIILDNGSTVAAMVPPLRSAQSLTVTTTSIDIVHDLADDEQIDLVGLGGSFRRPSRGFVGSLAEIALEHLSFDAAFLGADAVSPDLGLCEAELAQVHLKEMMARRAETTYVLADSSKLDRRPSHAWTRLDLPWTLVTDDGADPIVVERFRRAGIAVQLVPFEHASARSAQSSLSAS
jgi:DeoR/GlpR family transcriptional regulator of sugar metabolism